MEFRKNELLEQVLTNYYQTFGMTVDTTDIVGEKYYKKINATLFKHMKISLKQADKQYKRETRSGFTNKLISFVTAPFRIFTLPTKINDMLQIFDKLTINCQNNMQSIVEQPKEVEQSAETEKEE